MRYLHPLALFKNKWSSAIIKRLYHAIWDNGKLALLSDLAQDVNSSAHAKHTPEFIIIYPRKHIRGEQWILFDLGPASVRNFARIHWTQGADAARVEPVSHRRPGKRLHNDHTRCNCHMMITPTLIADAGLVSLGR